MQVALNRIAIGSRTPSAPSASLFAVIFCYLLSGQALASRDPLGTSLDWHIYAQLALFLISVSIALVLWARRGSIFQPPPYLWLFVAFGLLAVLSSVRSFWPALSAMKGCLFLLVLLLGQALCNTFPAQETLRAVYYGIVLLFVVAILMGVLMPGTYPLIVQDVVGRQRLALFADKFGDFAYLSGMGVLVGRLPIVRVRWYLQGFLLLLTFASGSRACTGALIFVLIASQFRRAKDFRLIIVACAASTAIIAILLLNGGSAIAAPLQNGLQQFYGADAVNQSPTELSGRLELWRAASATFRRSIFMGFGFDGARDQLLRIFSWAGGPHNAFLDLLLAGGGAGLIAFLWGVASAMRASFRSVAAQSSLSIYGFLLLVACTGQSFTMFQNFGVLLIICVHQWNCSLVIEHPRRGTASCGTL